MTDLNISNFVGILITIGLFAYMINLLQWGLFQILNEFFKEEEEDKKNFFHHHFHYKSKK